MHITTTQAKMFTSGMLAVAVLAVGIIVYVTFTIDVTVPPLAAGPNATTTNEDDSAEALGGSSELSAVDAQQDSTVLGSAAVEGGIGGPVTEMKLDYAEAMLVYQYRFQFDEQCNAIAGLPSFGMLNVKAGSPIMLDNRGDTTHRLAIGTQSAEVAASDYVVLTTENVAVATGFFITCDERTAGHLYVYP